MQEYNLSHIHDYHMLSKMKARFDAFFGNRHKCFAYLGPCDGVLKEILKSKFIDDGKPYLMLKENLFLQAIFPNSFRQLKLELFVMHESDTTGSLFDTSF